MLSGAPNADNAAITQAIPRTRGQDRSSEYDPLWVQHTNTDHRVVERFPSQMKMSDLYSSEFKILRIDDILELNVDYQGQLTTVNLLVSRLTSA